MQIDIAIESWHYAKPFRIAYHTFDKSRLLVVTITDGDIVGRGEAGDHPKLQSLEAGRDSILAISDALTAHMDQKTLMEALPRGPARNAVDCALWDLACKRARKRIWELAELPAPRRIQTALTIGIAPVEEMAEEARRRKDFRILKPKVDGHRWRETLEAITEARPDAELIIDANEGWSMAQLREFLAECERYRVRLLEQPLPVGDDEQLRGFRSPVPLVADESFQGLPDIDRLRGLYQVVNIKLDKVGGLTEGLLAARRAREAGLEVMVGCNGATSLGIAPAYCIGLLGQHADLDSPLILAEDREPRLQYDGSELRPPDAALWG